jgi:hypothetical protein
VILSGITTGFADPNANLQKSALVRLAEQSIPPGISIPPASPSNDGSRNFLGPAGLFSPSNRVHDSCTYIIVVIINTLWYLFVHYCILFMNCPTYQDGVFLGNLDLSLTGINK